MKTAWRKESQRDEAHLFDSLAVSLSGCWDDDLLSPVLTKKELQVFLDGRQSGQFGREVNWRDAWMVAVSVHLLLQCLVDLVQWAQEQLRREKRRNYGDWHERARAKSITEGFRRAPCTVAGWPGPSGSSASVRCSPPGREPPSSPFWSALTDPWSNRRASAHGNTGNCTFHPGNGLEHHSAGGGGGLQINQSSWVVPVGHHLPCCLFVRLHLCPWNYRQHIRELLSREMKACFSRHGRWHRARAWTPKKSDHIPSGKVMPVCPRLTALNGFLQVWVSARFVPLDLQSLLCSSCSSAFLFYIGLLLSPPLQLKGKRNTRERPLLNMTPQLWENK